MHSGGAVLLCRPNPAPSAHQGEHELLPAIE